MKATTAATTGIAAIDVPYLDTDSAGLTREATASRKLGKTELPEKW